MERSALEENRKGNFQAPKTNLPSLSTSRGENSAPITTIVVALAQR
jgi:hypothetical protein